MKIVSPNSALTSQQRLALVEMSRFKRSPQLAMRARIILLAQDSSLAQKVIAAHLKTSPRTVRVWINQFEKSGIPGLALVKPGRGRPSRVSATQKQLQKVALDWDSDLDSKMFRDLDPEMFPRLSQRHLSRMTMIPLASVNRALMRAGWRLPRGYIKRLTPETDDAVLIGVFLDPPFRALAMRLPEIEPRTSRKRVPIFKYAAASLVRIMENLEVSLTASAKRTGRTESWARFLRHLENLDCPDRNATFPIGVWCSHAGDAEKEVLDRCPHLTGFYQDQTPYQEWLFEAFAKASAALRFPVRLGDELRTFEWFLKRIYRQQNDGGAGYRRPFSYLTKWKTAGYNSFLGDSPRAGETDMTWSPVKLPNVKLAPTSTRTRPSRLDSKLDDAQF